MIEITSMGVSQLLAIDRGDMRAPEGAVANAPYRKLGVPIRAITMKSFFARKLYECYGRAWLQTRDHGLSLA